MCLEKNGFACLEGAGGGAVNSPVCIYYVSAIEDGFEEVNKLKLMILNMNKQDSKI